MSNDLSIDNKMINNASIEKVEQEFNIKKNNAKVNKKRFKEIEKNKSIDTNLIIMIEKNRKKILNVQIFNINNVKACEHVMSANRNICCKFFKFELIKINDESLIFMTKFKKKLYFF